MTRKFSADSIMKRLVKIAFDNIDYFRAHPTHLGWVMANFELLSRKCDYNPKYYILDFEAPREDIDFVYSAWSISVGNSVQCADPIHQPHLKKHMSVDDIVKTKLDPKYRYRSIYASRSSVINCLFMTVGTGIGWHEGYLTEIETGGQPSWLFVGYTICENEIEPAIKDKIKDLISSNKELNDYLQEEWGKIHSFNQADAETQRRIEYKHLFGDRDSEMELMLREALPEDAIEKTLERIKERSSKIAAAQLQIVAEDPEVPDYSELSRDYSNICLIPDNAEDSFVIEARKILKQIQSKQCTLSGQKVTNVAIDFATEILAKLDLSHPHTKGCV